jgi:hypothetical protein
MVLGAQAASTVQADASGAFSVLVGIFSYDLIGWSIAQVHTPDGELVPGISGGHQAIVGDAESE